ncbi:uncharacterized protein znf518a isoform 1-T2 [Synchiropus picturatus]
MDSVDVCADPATRDDKLRVNTKNRVWRKQLHCRKSAVQPPTMQSKDKNGPKKIPGEKVQCTEQPTSKKPLQVAQSSQHRTNDTTSSTLRFKCIKCKDDEDYIPKDLMKHFEEKHCGMQLVFPCHVCSFNTAELSFLQVHLLSHKDTFSSCIICKDDVQRTWPEFSAHLTMCHGQNGKYLCETCRKFSTEDPGVFIEHMSSCLSGLEGSLYSNDSNLLGCKTNTMLRCQHCSYETSRKWMLTNHINTNHVSLNGSQKRDKLDPRAKSTIPKRNHRLTRSAVKETCWLTQDCLDIDKYCHLPDPQKTLEQTQQFLMKSVTEGAGGQKLTKALQSVLSSVPQDINLHAMTENGIALNSADLTVLTVKNKITVAPNGATYAKRRKMMASVEKESPLTESAIDHHCVPAHNGCPENIPDQTHRPPADARLSDASQSTQDVLLECTRSRENGENQILKATPRNNQRTAPKDDAIPSEMSKTQEQTPTCAALIKAKRKKGRRKRKTRCKKQDLSSDLKIVLKKNPVKEKQWVSKSSLSPQGGLLNSHHEPAGTRGTKPDLTPDELSSEDRQKTKAEHLDPSKAILVPLQSTTQIGQEASKESLVTKRALRNGPVGLKTTEKKPVQEHTVQPVDAVQNVSSNQVPLPECSESSYGPSVTQPAITPHVPSDQKQEDVPEDGEIRNSSEVLTDQAVEQPPLPGFERRWQPAQKDLVRTLRIVAMSPSQPVKRPYRDQPIVVLNHPDADIPEVAKIMDIINRYRGDVQKVVLSRRTLSALSASGGDLPETGEETDSDAQPTVQERFILKMKLRRVNRKKYEVVEGASPGWKVESKFRCWFCGRSFTCQQTLMAHRRRHLMEWQGSNCENLGASLTLD